MTGETREMPEFEECFWVRKEKKNVLLPYHLLWPLGGQDTQSHYGLLSILLLEEMEVLQPRKIPFIFPIYYIFGP